MGVVFITKKFSAQGIGSGKQSNENVSTVRIKKITEGDFFQREGVFENYAGLTVGQSCGSGETRNWRSGYASTEFNFTGIFIFGS